MENFDVKFSLKLTEVYPNAVEESNLNLRIVHHVDFLWATDV